MKTALVALMILSLDPDIRAQTATAPAGAATAQIVAKAKEFLAALPENQRAKVLFKFTDDAQRLRWSNLPSPMYHREGLRLAEMGGPQRTAALALLAATLSRQGYEKVLAIMEGDEVLK